jgi:hypothetical protein
MSDKARYAEQLQVMRVLYWPGGRRRLATQVQRRRPRGAPINGPPPFAAAYG